MNQNDYEFKILNMKRKNSQYVFLVQGNSSFTIDNLIPRMMTVSENSTNYKLMHESNPVSSYGNLFIYDNRYIEKARPLHFANMRLDSTIIPNTFRLLIFDHGIGKQMIEKYARSIEIRPLKND